MVAEEVASIAKTYRRIDKGALNIYIYICIDAYISYIPLESLSSQSSYTHSEACILGVICCRLLEFVGDWGNDVGSAFIHNSPLKGIGVRE